MNEYARSIILQRTGASALVETEMIQELWSGYGKIMRVGLKNAAVKSVVVKQVQLPVYAHHPRGWNTDEGHQRKVKSYPGGNELVRYLQVFRQIQWTPI